MEQPTVGMTSSEFPAWECLRFSHPSTYEALKRSACRRYGAVGLAPISRPGSSSAIGSEVGGVPTSQQCEFGPTCERRGREHHRRSSSSRRRSHSNPGAELTSSHSTPSLPGLASRQPLRPSSSASGGGISALTVATDRDSCLSLLGGGASGLTGGRGWQAGSTPNVRSTRGMQKNAKALLAQAEEPPEFWLTSVDLHNLPQARRQAIQANEDVDEERQKRRGGPHGITRHGFSRTGHGSCYNYSPAGMN
mmetsp:Transcript_71806/g.186725  ORF Transcript_71806/g.186725 Transcript_71806/m.186725 type:complete len:250 (-) Transcript_71806:34-783(-)